jgi:hypothetical protein
VDLLVFEASEEEVMMMMMMMRFVIVSTLEIAADGAM